MVSEWNCCSRTRFDAIGVFVLLVGLELEGGFDNRSGAMLVGLAAETW
jgi:hypothetical protein